MYRLFYNHQVSKDVLFVLIDPTKEITSTKRIEEVVALYHDEEIVGYNIFDISKTVRIQSKGIIFYPDSRLIDAINSVLSRTGFPLLPYPSESGYQVMRISSVEEHPLDEKASIVSLIGKDDKKYETVAKAKNIVVGSLCVAALNGSILSDGALFVSKTEKNLPIDVLLMSPKMLKIGEEKDILFSPSEEDYGVGDDFFAPSKE